MYHGKHLNEIAVKIKSVNHTIRSNDGLSIARIVMFGYHPVAFREPRQSFTLGANAPNHIRRGGPRVRRDMDVDLTNILMWRTAPILPEPLLGQPLKLVL